MIANLQFLRGVAATMIVLIHLQVVLAPVLAAEAFAGSLHAGVDIFFVISGFIMVYVTADRSETGLRFLLGRVVRIVPVYWLFTTVFLLAALALPGLGQIEDPLGRYLPSLLFLPGDEPPRFMPLLYVGWTLNLEMYFYLLFAIGLASGLGRNGRLALVGALILLPVLLWRFAAPHPLFAFYGMPMVVEFLLGMLLAHFRDGLRRLPRVAGPAMAGAGVAWLIADPGIAETPFLARYAIPAVLLVAGAIRCEDGGWRIDWQPLMALGAASYALYISHPLVLSAFNNIQERVAPLQAPAPAIAFALVALAAAIAVALLVHYLFEKPVGARLKRLLHVPAKVEQPDLRG